MRVAERQRHWTDTERIAFLLDAAREFGSTLDADRIYASLRQLLSSVLSLDGLVVSSFEGVGETIHCEYVWADGQVLDSSAFPPVKWNPDGSGMQSHVILTGKAEIFDVGRKVKEPRTNYVEVTPEGGTAPIRDEPATRSAMMAPMVLEGRVTGVVQAMSDCRDAYSNDDLTIFESVVLLMTPAWHNARTYERASQERRLNDRILDTSPDIVYIFDLKSGKLVFSNGQLERTLGYSAQDVAAMNETTLPELMHPEDAAKLPFFIARYDEASEDAVLEAEWRIRGKDGLYHWILNRARVFEREADGGTKRIVGFASDITSKKEAEARQRLAEQRYRFMVETGPDIVWIAGPTGSIEFSNRRWAEYYGASSHQSTPDERIRAIHPEDQQAIVAAWRRAIETGSTYEGECRLRRYDGVYRWHICRATPTTDEEGVTRWFGVNIDIHDQKEIEAALEARVAERTKELQEAVKELEGFTYTVSHDLRGPLRAISAASMILREDYQELLPEEAHRHLLRQAEAAKKMGTLIDDLLKLSRIGRQELAPADIDLSRLTEEVIEELPGSGHQFAVEDDLQAFGDPRLVRFVLQNLIDNAIKFSPAGATIRVGKSNDAFFVADEGIGFEMDYAHKLFLPFERLVRENQYPGTGIGLANVHRIIQRHGGRVWAESRPGEGATFYFTLPRR